jgi:SAM-dependent methyltransferase
MNPHAYSLYTRLREPYFLEMLGPRGGELILDVGCGMGYFAERMVENGASCLGMDTDMQSLSFARRHVPAICGSATKIPLKDNTMGKILLADVLEHVEEEEAVVRELFRVARDGAVVVISCPSKEGLLSNSPLHALFHEEEGTPEYHFRSGYSLADLKELLETNNIRVTEVRYAVTFLGEMFIEALKLLLFFTKRDYTSQACVGDVNKSLLFKPYRYLVFPLIYGMSRVEDLLLSRLIKGHAIIIKGIVEKQT